MSTRTALSEGMVGNFAPLEPAFCLCWSRWLPLSIARYVGADTAGLSVAVTGCPHPREQVDEERVLGFLSVHKSWFLRHWTTWQEVGILLLVSYNSWVGRRAACRAEQATSPLVSLTPHGAWLYSTLPSLSSWPSPGWGLGSWVLHVHHSVLSSFLYSENPSGSLVQEPFQLATEKRAKERQELEKKMAEMEAWKLQQLEEARQQEEEQQKEELARLRKELVIYGVLACLCCSVFWWILDKLVSIHTGSKCKQANSTVSPRPP